MELLLVIDGINLNPVDTEYSRTPLLWAAIQGHEEIVGLLLMKDGVNPDSADKEGWTVRHLGGVICMRFWIRCFSESSQGSTLILHRDVARLWTTKCRNTSTM
jgi:Ankyrin repeats (many copies)